MMGNNGRKYLSLSETNQSFFFPLSIPSCFSYVRNTLSLCLFLSLSFIIFFRYFFLSSTLYQIKQFALGKDNYNDFKRCNYL